MLCRSFPFLTDRLLFFGEFFVVVDFFFFFFGGGMEDMKDNVTENLFQTFFIPCSSRFTLFSLLFEGVCVLV